MMRGKRFPPPVGYGLAVLLAGLAQLSRLPLHPPTLIPFITFAPFILLSAYQGGWGPGVLTTILCSLESLYFATEPVGSFRVRDPQDWLGLGALALTGVVASTLIDRLQQAQRAAAAAERERSDMAQELEARRPMLESVIEHSPVSIALLRGRDFRFEMVNPAYQAFAPGEPMLGRTVAEVWPEAAATLLPILEQVRDQRNVYQAVALAVPRRRGPGLPPEERYFDLSCVPLPGAGPGAEAGQVLVAVTEVTEQQRAAAELRKTLGELKSALAEKTVLLKEVHHRVKNNLAVIVSLLGMKAGAIEGAEAQRALEDSQQRVRSIASIHEHLSGNRAFGQDRFCRIRRATRAGIGRYIRHSGAADRYRRRCRTDRDGHPSRNSVRADPERAGDERVEARIPGRARRRGPGFVAAIGAGRTGAERRRRRRRLPANHARA